MPIKSKVLSLCGACLKNAVFLVYDKHFQKFYGIIRSNLTKSTYLKVQQMEVKHMGYYGGYGYGCGYGGGGCGGGFALIIVLFILLIIIGASCFGGGWC